MRSVGGAGGGISLASVVASTGGAGGGTRLNDRVLNANIDAMMKEAMVKVTIFISTLLDFCCL